MESKHEMEPGDCPPLNINAMRAISVKSFLKENYRPVSLLSCISKVMERVVYNSLYKYLKRHGLLSERNSGFKENDCTINQLIHLCNNIYKGLDKSKDVCVVFLDVSKAVDKVYHKGLLIKPFYSSLVEHQP